MILTITGPSASGKTALMGNLRKKDPLIRPLLSVTTRAARESDLEGEYEYVSQEQFQREAAQGRFLWHIAEHGNRYGTRASDVERALSTGMHVGLLVISAVRDLHCHAILVGKKEDLRHVYLRVNDEQELRRRLEGRGDPGPDIERRINDCRTWNREAETCGIRFRFITSRTQEQVLATALRYLGQKEERPRM